MDKLKKAIELHSRWQGYAIYIDRIETHIESDFSLSVENAKSLLEGICKQICTDKSVELKGDESLNKVVRFAFDAIGYKKGEFINVIAGALSSIGHQIGNLRTEIGSTSHGKTLEQLERRNSIVNEISRDFLVDSIDMVSSFLIRNYENEHPKEKEEGLVETLDYWEAEDFNEFWDDSFGEFKMGEYAYPASEILFNVDKQAYVNEYKAFIETEE